MKILRVNYRKIILEIFLKIFTGILVYSRSGKFWYTGGFEE